MKATLILADAASAHPDGTFSLLRGGITDLNVQPNRPAQFKGSLVARIVSTRAEAGPHEFKIACITEDGGEVIPAISGSFQTPANGGAVQIVTDLAIVFPKTGPFTFTITVDKIELDTWTLTAKESAQKGGKK